MPFIPVKAFALPELTTKHLIDLFLKLTLFIQSITAALGVLDVFDNDNLLDKVNKQETIMVKSLETMKDNYEFIGDVRGYGIMKGVEIVENKENKTPSKELASTIISNSKKNGLLLVNCGKEGNVIRFMGPLTTPLNQIREAMEMFNAALERI